MRRSLSHAVVFSVVMAAGFCLTTMTNGECDAIRQYKWSVQFGIGDALARCAVEVILLVGGVLLFRRLRRKAIPALNGNSALVYFAVLPLVVFHAQFVGIANNISHAPIERAVCAKSDLDGLTIHSSALSRSEYDFLMKQLVVLPELPAGADSISIDYYHDGFLPDFMLTVACVADTVSPQFRILRDWSVDTVHLLNGRPRFVYHGGIN